MNRKLILASAIALFMAVSCNNPATSSCDAAQTATTTQVTPSIVYVNTDSIYQGFTQYKELKEEFDTKAAKAQGDLETKSRSFERKVQDFQNKIQKGLITSAKANETQQSLGIEQQQILQLRETTMATLQEEERVMINNVTYSVEQYLIKFNKEHKYSLILSTSALTNTVLAADSTLDITATVLEGLNADYKANKGANKEIKPAK